MLIKVKVKTGAKRESLSKAADDRIVISVCEKPERGMANKRVTALLQEHFGRGTLVRLMRGQRSPSKIYLVARK